jgi:hypothetical protein
MNNTPTVVYVLAKSNFSYPHRQKAQPTIWASIYRKTFFETYIVAFNEM